MVIKETKQEIHKKYFSNKSIYFFVFCYNRLLYCYEKVDFCFYFLGDYEYRTFTRGQYCL